MTVVRLPKKLKKEPLIDAIFGVQFSSSVPASSIIPGLLFSKIIEPNKKIERLPIADIPFQIRNADPVLRFQPLLKLHFGTFFVLIGDSSLSVASVIPYIGWTAFKVKIIEVFQLLDEMKLIDTIDRYSMKYVNVVAGDNIAEQINKINVDIKVGNHELKTEAFNVRVEIPRDNFLQIVQIAATALVTLPNKQTYNGALIDIDTICNYKTDDISSLIVELPDRLQFIHDRCKTMFFECLKQETISGMEPLYD
jgi:uncharacterized protein (TIGR04255 family)